MSKCGVNSPDNAKFCIECGFDLEDTSINKKEKIKWNKTVLNDLNNIIFLLTERISY